MQFSVPLGIDSLSIFFILLNNLFIYLCVLHAYSSLSKSYGLLMCLFLLQ